MTTLVTCHGSFQDCVTPDNQTIVENVWPGDCRELSLNYVLDKARMMGAAKATARG